jgi:outer membrane biosynthesis protein TonB
MGPRDEGLAPVSSRPDPTDEEDIPALEADEEALAQADQDGPLLVQEREGQWNREAVDDAFVMDWDEEALSGELEREPTLLPRATPAGKPRRKKRRNTRAWALTAVATLALSAFATFAFGTVLLYAFATHETAPPPVATAPPPPAPTPPPPDPVVAEAPAAPTEPVAAEPPPEPVAAVAAKPRPKTAKPKPAAAPAEPAPALVAEAAPPPPAPAPAAAEDAEEKKGLFRRKKDR